MTQAQRRQMVDCPWLRDIHSCGEGAPSVRELGEAMAQAICSPFGSTDGKTFPVLDFDTKSISREALFSPLRVSTGNKNPIRDGDIMRIRHNKQPNHHPEFSVHSVLDSAVCERKARRRAQRKKLLQMVESYLEGTIIDKNQQMEIQGVNV